MGSLTYVRDDRNVILRCEAPKNLLRIAGDPSHTFGMTSVRESLCMLGMTGFIAEQHKLS